MYLNENKEYPKMTLKQCSFYKCVGGGVLACLLWLGTFLIFMVQSQNRAVSVPRAQILLQEKRQADAIKGSTLAVWETLAAVREQPCIPVFP